MAQLNVTGSLMGSMLTQMLSAQDIVPGDAPSYQLCKTIMAYHPLGAKMTDSPIKMAQSQPRDIVVPDGPEDDLREAFVAEWQAVGADRHIFNTGRLARAYGIASCALINEGVPPDREVNFKALHEAKIGFNTLDPLNTAGSLVLNQNPNSIDFQKVPGIAVGGVPYHRSRTVTLMNEDPLYIEYTSSAFGFVGRSVYQRALYMLKSYIQTLITDDMVSVKAGVIIAKMKGPGSVIDQAMEWVAGMKRQLLLQAVTTNVLSIDVDEAIETLNLQNLDGAFGLARKDIVENIATAADMPALLLNQETLAEGFGEGTEDAKRISAYIGGIRTWLEPLYSWFDQIVMYRAWNADFYKTIQKKYPDKWGGVSYTSAFYKWKNCFRANWPNLLEEPDSEKIKVADVQLKAIIAMLEVLAPLVTDPQNRAALIQWAAENFNEMDRLFTSPLVLDFDALQEAAEEQQEQQQQMIEQGGAAGGGAAEGGAAEGGAKEPGQPKPFAAQDGGRLRRALEASDRAVLRLPSLQDRRADLRGRG